MKISLLQFPATNVLFGLFILFNFGCSELELDNSDQNFAISYQLVSEVYESNDAVLAESVLKKFEEELMLKPKGVNLHLERDKGDYLLETWFRLWEIYSYTNSEKNRLTYESKIVSYLASQKIPFVSVELTAERFRRNQTPEWSKN